MQTPRFPVRRSVTAIVRLAPLLLAMVSDSPAQTAKTADNARAPRTLGIISGDDENEAMEPDLKFSPNLVAFTPRRKAGAADPQAAASAATSGGGGSNHLKDHPKGQEYVRKLQEFCNAREIDVALLGAHKYMINDCLGIKVSAGEFKLKFINPSVRLEGTGVVFECGIDHIELSAIKLRMRPRVPSVENPDPCKFSKKFEVGGDAKGVRIIMRFDPLLDAERCRIYDVVSIDTRVRIDELNLKPLQNDLDKMAKNMVEDAITFFLNFNFQSQLLQTLDDLIEADCPGHPGDAARSARNLSDRPDGTDGATPAAEAGPPGAGTDSDLADRLGRLESRVAELEKRIASGDARPADAGPSGTPASPAAEPTTGPSVRSGGAFEIAANPGLKGRLGRLVVTFPEKSKDINFHGLTEVYRAGSKDRVEYFYESGQVELLPGDYDVVIGGHKVAGVSIQSRHDTRMLVGVLRTQGGAQTVFNIHDVGAKERLHYNYGTADTGLPVGEYEVLVKDQRQKVKIEAGKVTEF